MTELGLVGSWVETSSHELRACGTFDDESSSLWTAAPTLAMVVRDSDPDRGAQLLEARLAAARGDDDGAAEVIATSVTVGVAVLQRADTVVVFETQDRALILGQSAGWTCVLLLMRESTWIRATPHLLADELENQRDFLSLAGRGRLTMASHGRESMALVDGDVFVVCQPGSEPRTQTVGRSERGEFIRELLLSTAPAETGSSK